VGSSKLNPTLTLDLRDLVNLLIERVALIVFGLLLSDSAALFLGLVYGAPANRLNRLQTLWLHVLFVSLLVEQFGCSAIDCE